MKAERFRQLIARYQWPDIKAEDLAVTFQERLSTHADLLPGAMHLIEALHGKMKIALVSNGVSATQGGLSPESSIPLGIDNQLFSSMI